MRTIGQISNPKVEQVGSKESLWGRGEEAFWLSKKKCNKKCSSRNVTCVTRCKISTSKRGIQEKYEVKFERVNFDLKTGTSLL